MSLLTTPKLKISHILTEKRFIFLQRLPTPSLKVFQYQHWIIVKSLKKELSDKRNFRTSLKLSGSSV